MKSTDAGKTWSLANQGLTNTDVQSLAIHPSDPSTIYAGVADITGNHEAVFVSTDGARTWTASGIAGLPEGAVIAALAFHPVNPSTLYAGNVGGGEAAYRTGDGGLTWRPAGNGFGFSSRVRALQVDPADPRTVYAGTEVLGSSGEGVFKTIDGGRNWFPASTGELALSYVFALAMDPSDRHTLYAGATNGLDGGVYKTTNGGAAWTRLTEDSPVRSLAIDPSNPATVYAGTYDDGVLKTTDGGVTWNAVNDGLTDLFILALAIDSSHPLTLYAGTWRGWVARSSRGGVRWKGARPVAFTASVNALAVAPLDPNTMYAGTALEGVFKSTDGGASWFLASGGIPPDTSVYALAIDPADTDTVYAGARYEGVFKTTDGGVTWLPSDQGIPTEGVIALSIDPSDPGTIYAGTYVEGVFKSTDGGASWSLASGGIPPDFSVYALVIDPSNPAILYAGTENTYSWEANNDGVFKSTDGGATWVRSSRGIGGCLPEPSPCDSSVYALAIDRTAPSTIYAAAACVEDPYENECNETEIHKSTDGGASWASALDIWWAGDPGFSSIVIDPSDPFTVWAGHDEQLGPYLTTDGGATWAEVDQGLNLLAIYALAIQPASPHALYAGTSSGVFAFVEA